MLFTNTTEPLFTTMEDANAYRRQITQELTTAAQQGDAETVQRLQARYAAIPLLIAGLVVNQAQAGVTAWEQALSDCQQAHGEAYRREHAAHAGYKQEAGRLLLASTEDAFHTAQQAAIQTNALQDKLMQLQSGVHGARGLVQKASDALLLAVSNPNGGLGACDKVLQGLAEQQIVLARITADTARVPVAMEWGRRFLERAGSL